MKLFEFYNMTPGPMMTGQATKTDAYKHLLDLDPYLKKNQKISVTTVKHFLQNVYMGGDSNLDLREFVIFLRKKGITVKRRKKLYK